MRWMESLKKKLPRSWSKRKPAVCDAPDAQLNHKPWNPQRTLLGLKWLLLAVIVVTVVVGWKPAERALAQYVGQRRPQPVTLQTVRLTNVPAWMPAGFRARMQKLVAEQVSPDPMDSLSLQRAADRLLATGWIDQVQRVKRVAGGIEVEARYRTPAAFVAQPNGFRLIDANHVLLPGTYQAQHLSMLRVPLIVGAPTTQAKAGQTWNAPELPQALELLRWLGDQPYASQIRAVDVSQRDALGRSRLTLLCEHGSVVWGLPVGKEQMVEPSATVKKSWLAEVMRQYGTIDAGGRIVEVYGPAVFIRESPASAQNDQDLFAAGGYTWAR